MSPTRYPFAFDARFRVPLAGVGVSPRTAWTELGVEFARVRFGPWLVVTRLRNIADAVVTGPFAWYRALGVRLSLADRGLTFGTNAEAGVCLRFHELVRGADPLGLLRHPALTVTVADPGGLVNAIEDRVRAGFPDNTGEGARIP